MRLEGSDERKRNIGVYKSTQRACGTEGRMVSG